jgi:hypothetical protein
MLMLAPTSSLVVVASITRPRNVVCAKDAKLLRSNVVSKRKLVVV